jgi:protein-S-isoprenylcysteine O-methyltransferase Ste14
MTKDQIFSILDFNCSKNKKALWAMIVVGAAFMLGGLLMYLNMSTRNNNNVIGGATLGGLGLLMIVACAIALMSTALENRTKEAKDILDRDPQQLVWSYVYKQNNKGAIHISVIMNFRNGKRLSVSQNAIINQDTNAFMTGLVKLNPQMHIGYSEELEYKFKKKTL